MWFMIFLLIAGINYVTSHDFQVLTSNFFDNLQADPALLADNNLSDKSKQFIETQISNYVKLVTFGERNANKKKRSLLDNFTKNIKGTYLLSNVTPSATIPVRFPLDLTLFEQNSHWHAAALESADVKENANYLVIFKFENQTFNERARTPVKNGVKLATIDLGNSTLIAVAENDTSRDNFHNKSGIYQFDKARLSKIQSIDMHYANDITLWKIHDEVYMSFAQFMTNQSGHIQYEAKIPVYKWLGNHFDLVQNIASKGTRKITPFKVDHVNFLAIANFRDNQGNTRVYSEIHKYDYHLEKYVLYQSILTKACSDIKVFTLSQDDHKKDTFLIVANFYDKDSDGNINYATDSIIYKYVDNYFIPFQTFRLNGIQQWLPIQGEDDEFALIATSAFDGLKYFQYDGWSFSETVQKTVDLVRSAGIKSIRFAKFNNSYALVVSSKNNKGKTANIFRLEFTHLNVVNEIYADMSTWCDSGLAKIEEMVNGDVFDEVLGEAERADIDEEKENTEIQNLNSQIDSLNSLLDQLNVFHKPEQISAEVIIFNNSTFIQNLVTDKINNFETNKLLENTLNIELGFDLGEVSFVSLITDESLKAHAINARDPQTLLHTSDNLNLTNLKVQGNLSAPKGIKVEGKLNNMSINNKSLLLKSGDQNFSQPLVLQEAEINKITAKSLNGQDLANLRTPTQEPIISHLETLKVKNLTIGGYINNVDVPTLDKYALKKSGNQQITSEFIFDEIQGKNLEVFGEISGKKVSDLISANSGNYSLNSEIIFKNDLFVDDLEVSKSLDGIEVFDGKLDILLKDSREEQEITGAKIFDDVIIYHAINFQGHVKSKNLEKMNPLITIENDLVLTGPKTITGHVQIENLVSVKDIVTTDGTYSLTWLEADGLKLTSKEVKPHLHFVQQINIDEIFVDTLNGKNPHDFVVTGTEESQIIQSVKTFLGDVRVTGGTNAIKINDVEIEELENKVLRINGDQEIEGKHHIKHVIADKISSNETKFNEALNQTSSENVVINRDLKVDKIKTGSITVKGLVNNLNFTQIVNDTVKKDSDRLIGGHKNFNKLTINNLHTENGITLHNLAEIDKLTIDKPINLTNIKVENIYFENEFNGVDKKIFGNENNTDHTIIPKNLNLDTVVVFGNVYIASNKISEVEIEDLVENSVKLDEPFEFNSATFESQVISRSRVSLNGHIEDFDFENALLPNSDKELIIIGEKNFKNSVTINGSFVLDGLLNGINVTQFCEFSMGESEGRNVTIDGNVYFAMGPNIGKINNVNINEIRNRAWFKDRDVNLTGSVHFDDIIFENDIYVKGYVENISLNLLYENYFSKSKDQNITATFKFENDLIFENNVTVPEISLNGRLNNIDLDEFVKTALLNDYEQIFETVVFIEDCVIENLNGDFLVNNLDLETDVMRYDKDNMVTGTKIFENLNVDYLKLEKNIKIQDVDVLEWFKNSVLKTTSFNITADKSFTNANFANGFQVSGKLNDHMFDSKNIMVTNIPQEITGKKIIHTSQLNSVMFKSIKLKGLLNDVDLSKLINDQAYKNQENIFKTRLNFANNITTNNLIIKKTYQQLNMTELIMNVTNLGVLNNLLEQYNKVLDMTYKLENSVKGQAYFMHHYKTIQIIPRVKESKMIFCSDNILRIGSLVTDEDGLRMDLYGWSPEKQFLNNGIIQFTEPLVYIDQVFSGRYLYMERQNGTGSFTLMSRPVFQNTLTIPTNFTRSTASFVLPYTGTNCTLFIYDDCAPKIFCEIEGSIELLQSLDSSIGLKGTSKTIEGTLYLAIITEPREGLESQIDLWRLNNNTGYFEIHQTMFEAQPRSIATASYNGFHYLAIACGHLQNAIYSGRVEIRKFDELSLQFVPWQSLELDAPIQVEFSILPSNELVLYVVTDNPTQPLLVYRYEGIAGFKLALAASTLPKILYMNLFMGGDNQHFIIAQSYDEINVIQAIFKGEKVADG
ncbi:uncharacterized protein LOC123005441 [Tribolium madens]|uniref:uncharacterized protein LOC123005441 n=1 Tax=Tribolium madens TaxID=41895 RepID=UPI001CF740AB|nr:uncharacterized protein LOC123005441 [Tribolium madens]